MLHLDMHRGTCGAGEGDRYLWWKSLETIMTSDGVVRAAQLSRGTWLGIASGGYPLIICYTKSEV